MTLELRCQSLLAKKVQSEISSLERNAENFQTGLQEKLLYTLTWNVEQIIREQVLLDYFRHIQKAFTAMESVDENNLENEIYCVRITKCINSFRERFMQKLLTADFASTSSSVGHNIEKVQTGKALAYLIEWLEGCSGTVHNIFD